MLSILNKFDDGKNQNEQFHRHPFISGWYIIISVSAINYYQLRCTLYQWKQIQLSTCNPNACRFSVFSFLAFELYFVKYQSSWNYNKHRKHGFYAIDVGLWTVNSAHCARCPAHFPIDKRCKLNRTTTKTALTFI